MSGVFPTQSGEPGDAVNDALFLQEGDAARSELADGAAHLLGGFGLTFIKCKQILKFVLLFQTYGKSVKYKFLSYRTASPM